MNKTKIKTLSALTHGIAKTCGGFVLSAGALSILSTLSMASLPAFAQTGFNNAVNMPTVNLTGQGGSPNYNAPLPEGNNTNNTNNSATNNSNVKNVGNSATTSAVAAPSSIQSRNLSPTANPTNINTKTRDEVPAFEAVEPVEVGKPVRKSTKNKLAPTPVIAAPNSIQSPRNGITLTAPQPYVQGVKSRYNTLLQERERQVIPITSQEAAQRMELSKDANYISGPAIPPTQGDMGYSESGVSFTETQTQQPLLVSDIDFERSFIAVGSLEGQDVKVQVVGLLDIQEPESQQTIQSKERNAQPTASAPFDPLSKNAFIYDEAAAISKAGQSQTCSSSTLYLSTKNLNNFVYSVNRYDDKKCGRFIMVADSGTLNAKDDRFINVTVGEQNKQQVIKLDILKNGWADPQKRLLFGQPALMVLANQKMDLWVAPQVDRNSYHYAKVGDISYNNYKMSSPFTYKTTLPKNKTYRAFAITQGDEKVNYYPTTVFVEDLDAQFKLISQ